MLPLKDMTLAGIENMGQYLVQELDNNNFRYAVEVR
jgi:hypothetical protein